MDHDSEFTFETTNFNVAFGAQPTSFLGFVENVEDYLTFKVFLMKVDEKSGVYERGTDDLLFHRCNESDLDKFNTPRTFVNQKRLTGKTKNIFCLDEPEKIKFKGTIESRTSTLLVIQARQCEGRATCKS